jgi:hypothetical protein
MGVPGKGVELRPQLGGGVTPVVPPVPEELLELLLELPVLARPTAPVELLELLPVLERPTAPVELLELLPVLERPTAPVELLELLPVLERPTAPVELLLELLDVLVLVEVLVLVAPVELLELLLAAPPALVPLWPEFPLPVDPPPAYIIMAAAKSEGRSTPSTRPGISIGVLASESTNSFWPL